MAGSAAPRCHSSASLIADLQNKQMNCGREIGYLMALLRKMHYEECPGSKSICILSNFKGYRVRAMRLVH